MDLFTYSLRRGSNRFTVIIGKMRFQTLFSVITDESNFCGKRPKASSDFLSESPSWIIIHSVDLYYGNFFMQLTLLCGSIIGGPARAPKGAFKDDLLLLDLLPALQSCAPRPQNSNQWLPYSQEKVRVLRQKSKKNVAPFCI